MPNIGWEPLLSTTLASCLISAQNAMLVLKHPSSRSLFVRNWFWMSGDSMDYNNWDSLDPWVETSPCGAINTNNSFHWNDLICSDHLHFICLKGKDSYINHMLQPQCQI